MGNADPFGMTNEKSKCRGKDKKKKQIPSLRCGMTARKARARTSNGDAAGD